MHKWKPIEPIADCTGLQLEELRSLEKLWKNQRTRLSKVSALNDFQERMRRWWSIETGIIERLYSISEGITLQLVQHGFVANLITHGESNIASDKLIAILQSHRDSLDLVMDVVGGTRSLTTGWIKELHGMLTQHQDNTDAVDQFGHWVKIPLIQGDWKVSPNNPMTSIGAIHEYCPPEHVASEMDRLLQYYNELPNWPELRAAFLHHRFTQIHPFQDGNGRVARALASIDFIRAGLFPMLVRRTERDKYIDGLRDGDAGDLLPMVTYFGEVQKNLLMRAIRESEDVIDGKANLSTVLAAAAQKRGLRQVQQGQIYKNCLVGLMDLAVRHLSESAVEVKQMVPDIQTQVSRADENSRHWYRRELLSIANQYNHWIDFNAYRDWVRFQLKDGGVTEIIVACYMIGSPSEGAGVAVVFVTHRERQEKTHASTLFDGITQPLLFSVEENAQHLLHRFSAWLNTACIQALAQWTQFL